MILVGGVLYLGVAMFKEIRRSRDLIAQQGTQLQARVSQQELADAVGSVREVVTRTLALLPGDTAVADGKYLEQCLSQFHFKGPKLFLCGNHELWTRGDDSSVRPLCR